MEFKKKGISKYGNFNINCDIGLEWYYCFEDYYYSHDIRMIDIQTDPIEHFPIKKLWNECVEYLTCLT